MDPIWTQMGALSENEPMFTETITIPAALLAGVLSFFSPCILPLIPAYFSFISGYSLEELIADPSAQVRRRVILATMAYVLGFSFVFILMGASASLLGNLIFQYRNLIRIIGGVLIIALGIHLLGIFKIPGLDMEHRIHLRQKPLHGFGAFLVVMAVGAGWSPCIGPLLGSILIVAGNQATITRGMMLLAIYSLGLAIPFLIISLFINWILTFIKRATRVVRFLNTGAGVLLIAVGLLLITDMLYILNLS